MTLSGHFLKKRTFSGNIPSRLGNGQNSDNYWSLRKIL